MPRIIGVSTAVPENTLTQAGIKQFIQTIFSSYPEADRLLPVFDNAQIDTRHFAIDYEWYSRPRSFTETNDLYIEQSIILSKQVTLDLSSKFGVPVEEIDLVIFVSTTGISTPSIDARLFSEVHFNPHVKRLPIWGLGCAAGASAIARANDFTRAYPDAKVLIIAVELCGLQFQREPSKENFIAAALFGDGAAACLVVGDNVRIDKEVNTTPKILGSYSTIYEDTLDVMGWKITTEGFKLLLSKDIPTIVMNHLHSNVEELLQLHGLAIDDIAHYITHPGGAKVLDAYTNALALEPKSLTHARSVLRENGNMSSVTVFFILDRFLNDGSIASGDYGLISALGPGFSSELVLIRW